MKYIVALLLVIIAVLGINAHPQSKAGVPQVVKIPQVVCNEPEKDGICMAYMPRFRYNPESKTCVEFIYGGCGGNNNRFVSQKECEEYCKGV